MRLLLLLWGEPGSFSFLLLMVLRSFMIRFLSFFRVRSFVNMVKMRHCQMPSACQNVQCTTTNVSRSNKMLSFAC